MEMTMKINLIISGAVLSLLAVSPAFAQEQCRAAQGRLASWW
jgi:hypothetical protein